MYINIPKSYINICNTITHLPWTKWSPFRRPFKCIFLNEMCNTLIRISLKCVPKLSINHKRAMVKATSHYLNQCSPDSLKHIWGTRGRWVKSLRTCYTNIHNWNGPSLVQVVACHLVGAKALPEQMPHYCQLDLLNEFQWNFKILMFARKNAFEIVWKMLAILLRPQCVDYQNNLPCQRQGSV